MASRAQHPLAAHHLDRADGEFVAGIGHRDDDAFVGLAQRQCLRVPQEPVRDALLEERQLGILGRRGDGDPEPLRQGVGQVAGGNQPQPAQDDAQLLARLAFLEAQRALEVGGIELAAGEEDLAQAARLALGREGGHGGKIIAHRHFGPCGTGEMRGRFPAFPAFQAAVQPVKTGVELRLPGRGREAEGGRELAIGQHRIARAGRSGRVFGGGDRHHARGAEAGAARRPGEDGPREARPGRLPGRRQVIDPGRHPGAGDRRQGARGGLREEQARGRRAALVVHYADFVARRRQAPASWRGNCARAGRTPSWCGTRGACSRSRRSPSRPRAWTSRRRSAGRWDRLRRRASACAPSKT